LHLGVLYPPCGAEWEYYRYGERIAPEVRVALVGVRIFGGDDEHAPGHMARTGSVANLGLSAEALVPVSPAAAIWACTSGSFISGLAHARTQVDALERVLGCPCTSTSLAFVLVLKDLAIDRVSVLASYRSGTAQALVSFLAECGIEVETIACLDYDSGPAAARVGDDRLLERVGRMAVPEGGALLIPDTAIPTLHLVPRLQDSQAVPVITANQVSLWALARLVGKGVPAEIAGALPAASPATAKGAGR